MTRNLIYKTLTSICNTITKAIYNLDDAYIDKHRCKHPAEQQQYDYTRLTNLTLKQSRNLDTKCSTPTAVKHIVVCIEYSSEGKRTKNCYQRKRYECMVIEFKSLCEHSESQHNNHNGHKYTKCTEAISHKQRREPRTTHTRRAVARKFALPVKQMREHRYKQICTKCQQDNTDYPTRSAKSILCAIITTLLTPLRSCIFRLSLYYYIHKLYIQLFLNNHHLPAL